MAFSLEREYSSYLLFYDHTFQDIIPTAQRSWEVHGGADGYQIDFDRMDSIFNELCQTNARKAMTILDATSYMLYTNTIDITKTNYYTMAFWIYLPQDSFETLLEIKSRYIPIVRWDDNNGHTVKINIAEQIEDDDYNVAMTIDYSGYKKHIIPYLWSGNTWMHVLINRDGSDGIDRVFIDGKLRLETKIDTAMVNRHVFHNLQLGNPDEVDQSGIYQYSVDEFCLCDDLFVTKDFPVPDSYLFWLWPEVLHTTTDPDTRVLEPVYGAPGFYNANKSRWDVVLDHLEITRPVYWTRPEDAQLKSRNKINFNTFHYAHSNFAYKDKNKISDITPY